MTVELTPSAERTSWRSLPPYALVPIAAVVWWVVGFLPWLLDGARPAVPAGSAAPLITIPLYAGHVSELVIGAGLGGVAAGMLALWGSGPRWLSAGACGAGVAGALLVTVLQSRHVVNDSTFISPDTRITGGLSVVAILTALVGLGMGSLAVTGRIGLGLALATVAGAAPLWLHGVFMAVGLDVTGPSQALNDLSRWAGAAILAVALIIIGMRPVARLAAWPGALLLAWFIAPTITAAGYMEVFLRPGMGLPDMWGDQLSATADVWRMAASLDARPLTPWITAIVVAGAVALWLARQPTAARPQPAQ